MRSPPSPMWPTTLRGPAGCVGDCDGRLTMGRVFLFFVVLLGIGLYRPDSRAVILEYTSPLANPALRWMTNQELRQIVDDLDVVQGSGQAFPSRPEEFDAWLNRRYPQEGSRMDAWGTRYRLNVSATHFRVISAGPDGVFGTEDDVFREAQRRQGGR